jgi:hypothetical protein
MLDAMQEVKDAERFAVRAYGRISLVIDDHPDDRLAAAKEYLAKAVVELNEWKLAQDAE